MKKTKFLNGSSDILKKFSEEISAIRYMFSRFGNFNDDDNSKIVNGYNKIKAVYDFVFKEQDREAYNKLNLEVSSGLRRICMKLCNGFER